jgi:uncharacterized phage protein (TIGR02220 family)
MHYYQHNIGDYRKDTAHLSLLEHGIYRQALDLYYLEESPLPKDDAKLMRLLCVRSADEKQALCNVLADFFILTEKGYEHARCDKELGRIYDKSDAARKAAKARWDKEKQQLNADAMQTHSGRNADGMLPNNPLPNNPLPNNPLPNTKKKNKKPLSGKPDVAAEIIDYLNRKTGKAFKSVASNTKLINARLSEGHSRDDIKAVIDRKVSEWANNPKMRDYLRPATLFNAEKFNQYVGELGVETIADRNDREIQDWIEGKDNQAGIIEGEWS